MASILPTSRISLYAIGSFFVSVIVMEFGVKSAWVFYAVTCLTSVFVVPEKTAVIPFALFFGAYGIVKYHIEKIGKIITEYVLKYLYFNVCLFLAVFLVKELFLESIRIDFPWWIVIVVLEVVFIIYDYVYTLFVRYYISKIKRIVKM
jgi:hypothetical protein